MPFLHFSLRRSTRRAWLCAAAGATAAIIAVGGCSASGDKSVAPAATGDSDVESVQLTDSELRSIKVGSVVDREFPIQKEAVGSIDFNENLNVQVFTPYQGRILRTFADLGDQVKQGQTLFTIESPDFIQAESNLISAAGVLDQTTSALTRAKQLYTVKGIDQNDFETAVANQQTAEGALRAARNAVAIFGKTVAEIDQIVSARQVETALVVKSPITGRITARNAAPGLLAQPGVPPAPYSVADLSRVWMLANVIESDSPASRWIRTLLSRSPPYRVECSQDTLWPSARPSIPIRAASQSARRSRIRSTNCGQECSPTSSFALAPRCTRQRCR